ncbi:MAG: hypothetical protein ABIO45_10535, partial [Burkholderiaceae bacterium]
MRRVPSGAAWALAAALVGSIASRAQAQDEVPFVTTPDRVTLAMLDLAGVGPTDHVIDFGSGDGRIVITAARRFGASGLGVEIVPDLVLRSRANARVAGVQERVEFREQDLFGTDLGRASVVTMYLLPEVNLQLRPRLLALAPGTRIVSHDWDMGDWRPDRSVTIDVPEKSIGREKSSRVHLWQVPAQVHGLWCTAGASLHIDQRFQQFSATLHVGSTAATPSSPPVVFDGRIAATLLQSTPPSTLRMELVGGSLLVREAGGTARDWGGRRFDRAAGAR